MIKLKANYPFSPNPNQCTSKVGISKIEFYIVLILNDGDQIMIIYRLWRYIDIEKVTMNVVVDVMKLGSQIDKSLSSRYYYSSKNLVFLEHELFVNQKSFVVGISVACNARAG